MRGALRTAAVLALSTIPMIGHAQRLSPRDSSMMYKPWTIEEGPRRNVEIQFFPNGYYGLTGAVGAPTAAKRYRPTGNVIQFLPSTDRSAMTGTWAITAVSSQQMELTSGSSRMKLSASANSLAYQAVIYWQEGRWSRCGPLPDDSIAHLFTEERLFVQHAQTSVSDIPDSYELTKKPEAFWELASPAWQLVPTDLAEADKLNGLQYAGVFKFRMKAQRRLDAASNAISDWQEATSDVGTGSFSVAVRNGAVKLARTNFNRFVPMKCKVPLPVR